MGKILGIDYGLKRTGIAITDEMRIIASPLETVPTHTIWDYLNKMVPREGIEVVVVGQPLGLNGKSTDATGPADGFCKKLKNKFEKIEVVRINEMFTSKLATRALIEGGAKKSKRRTKGTVDKVSAAIILQDYLNYGPSIF